VRRRARSRTPALERPGVAEDRRAARQARTVPVNIERQPSRHRSLNVERGDVASLLTRAQAVAERRKFREFAAREERILAYKEAPCYPAREAMSMDNKERARHGQAQKARNMKSRGAHHVPSAMSRARNET